MERLQGIGLGLLALLCLVLVGVALEARRFGRTIQGHVDDLYSDADTPPGGEFAERDLRDLPEPVARYFETVLDDGQAYVDTVALRQRGEFRLGGPEGSWRRLAATQHFSAVPPAFVWDAKIAVAPLLPARVLDCYVRGAGILRARVLSAIPVASAGPSPEMDEGELVRFLAEAVWFPTALLPGRGVAWEPIDDSSARATISHDGSTATLVFHFDEDGLVERVTGERYRQEDDDYAPWVGYFEDYAERNGRLIPQAGEVAWDLPDGESSYWRGTIKSIEHRPANAGR